MTKRTTDPRFLFFFLLALTGAVLSGAATGHAGQAPADIGSADAGAGSGTYLYDLDFSLRVTGDMTLLTRTRFCKAEQLSLKLAAASGPSGWNFESLRLNEAEDAVHFAVGEGPKRHQRYVLLSSNPTDQQKQTLEARIVAWEDRHGCGVAGTPDSVCREGEEAKSKKAFFNYYLFGNPRGAFRFVMDPQGKTQSVDNQTDVRVLSEPGGRKARPRFFELLEYALLCVPPFSGPSVYSVASDKPVRWEVDCRPILDGLIQLVKNVYGRKMSLIDPERIEKQKVVYKGYFLPHSRILRAEAEVGPMDPVPIRVSGFKGTIWIQGFKREICLDTEHRRILKDVFEISFGIVRNTKIFPVKCEENSVRVSLVEEGASNCGAASLEPASQGNGASRNAGF